MANSATKRSKTNGRLKRSADSGAGNRASAVKESEQYRTARKDLLDAEVALSDQVERVAQLRRNLPLGRRVKDYTFREGPPDLQVNSPTSFFDTKLSELFRPGNETLIVDHLMFAPDDDRACKMCSMWADGYNAVAPHVRDKTNFVLVARAPIAKLRDWARARGWHTLRLLSSYDSTFNRDMDMEEDKDSQRPGVSVFVRKGEDEIYHSYSITAEMKKGHFRGIDPYSPVWNLFDLLPEGREDWFPEHFYH